MTVSSLRNPKSETREMAERDRLNLRSRLHEPTDWSMSNNMFFVAFVVIAALVTVLVLVLR
ncbi:MAG: hypothetical protein H0T79_04385 [Deltaproteobacteria bacterium]|nr:hypothetical protein [Deltaproteobacteria bacterium]